MLRTIERKLVSAVVKRLPESCDDVVMEMQLAVTEAQSDGLFEDEERHWEKAERLAREAGRFWAWFFWWAQVLVRFRLFMRVFSL